MWNLQLLLESLCISKPLFSSQFITREGEAPAEPLHRWLGRSLALPLFSAFSLHKHI